MNSHCVQCNFVIVLLFLHQPSGYSLKEYCEIHVTFLFVLFFFFFLEHSGITTGVKFGKHASFIASVGLDRHLKFYSR